MKNEKTVVDIDYAEAIVPKSARRGIVTMFMIMLGFTFFSASMWVGQQLADGLDFQGFVVSMIVGGVILSLYTGLLGYVGAETGMSLDLLARKAFGVKGSYLPSAMISFTQIGWFGVGIAMFAIPVANELLGGSKTAEWALVIVAGICMTPRPTLASSRSRSSAISPSRWWRYWVRSRWCSPSCAATARSWISSPSPAAR